MVGFADLRMCDGDVWKESVTAVLYSYSHGESDWCDGEKQSTGQQLQFWLCTVESSKFTVQSNRHKVRLISHTCKVHVYTSSHIHPIED